MGLALLVLATNFVRLTVWRLRHPGQPHPDHHPHGASPPPSQPLTPSHSSGAAAAAAAAAGDDAHKQQHAQEHSNSSWGSQAWARGQQLLRSSVAGVARFGTPSGGGDGWYGQGEGGEGWPAAGGGSVPSSPGETAAAAAAAARGRVPPPWVQHAMEEVRSVSGDCRARWRLPTQHSGRPRDRTTALASSLATCLPALCAQPTQRSQEAAVYATAHVLLTRLALAAVPLMAGALALCYRALSGRRLASTALVGGCLWVGLLLGELRVVSQPVFAALCWTAALTVPCAYVRSRRAADHVVEDLLRGLVRLLVSVWWRAGGWGGQDF